MYFVVWDLFTKNFSLFLTVCVSWDGFRGNIDILVLCFVHLIAKERLLFSRLSKRDFIEHIDKVHAPPKSVLV